MCSQHLQKAALLSSEVVCGFGSAEAHAKTLAIGVAQVHTNHVIDIDGFHTEVIKICLFQRLVGHAFIERDDLAPGQIGHQIRGVVTISVGVAVVVDEGLCQLL